MAGPADLLLAVRSDGEQPHNGSGCVAIMHRHCARPKLVFEPGNGGMLLRQQIGIEGAEVASCGAPSLDTRDANLQRRGEEQHGGVASPPLMPYSTARRCSVLSLSR